MTIFRRLSGALLRALLARRGVIEAPLLHDARRDLALIRRTRARVTLLLCDAAALQIVIAVRAANRLDAAMAEAGVFRGGSAALICAAKGDRHLHLFDVFETLQNGETGGDLPGATVRQHFGTVHGRHDAVAALLANERAVSIHPGVFPDTASVVQGERFSFVHLDLDLPDATGAALAFFYPRLVAGGVLIGDDYADPAVRAVFTRFMKDKPDTAFTLPWGQIMIVRLA